MPKKDALEKRIITFLEKYEDAVIRYCHGDAAERACAVTNMIILENQLKCFVRKHLTPKKVKK